MTILSDIEAILAASSVEDVWYRYISRLSDFGFPHVSYQGIRILQALGGCVADDRILLTSHPPQLVDEIVSQDLLGSVPMRRWMDENISSASWDWMRARRQAGRLSPSEERALDLFARYGQVAGYAINLGDRVPRIRAGVLLTGEIGARQAMLDHLWAQHGRNIEVLTGLMHLRLSTLPYIHPGNVLTLRQREVLECSSIGRTTQEIAGLLDVTPATVEKHLRLARKALGARTTAQAVLLATSRRQIFLDPGDEAAAENQSPLPPPGPGSGGAWASLASLGESPS